MSLERKVWMAARRRLWSLWELRDRDIEENTLVSANLPAVTGGQVAAAVGCSIPTALKHMKTDPMLRMIWMEVPCRTSIFSCTRVLAAIIRTEKEEA